MFPEINRMRKMSTMISVFRGLNRTVNCGFARISSRSSAYMTELSEMENLCGDDYPRLRTRKKRYSIVYGDNSPSGNMLTANQQIIYSNFNGYLRVGSISYAIPGYQSGAAHFLTFLGNRVLILPEKLCFDLSAHTFSNIEFSSTTEGIAPDSTTLNVAKMSWINYRKRDDPNPSSPYYFRDFSIEKVVLNDSGVPVKVAQIYEKASSMEDYAKQTWDSGASVDADADTWQLQYRHHWNYIKNGETIEVQGESPSGIYQCVDIMPCVDGHVSVDGVTYSPHKNLRRFVKLESSYVKISRSGGAFSGVKKGDFVRISGMTDAVKKPLITEENHASGSDVTYTYWADVDGVTVGNINYPSGFWGNYLDVLNNNTFKVYYADADCIVVKAPIDKSVPYIGPMTVTRLMPAVDNGMMLEVNNRLWACSSAANEIYSCKQGDCTNWQAFGDGIATDSFAATVGCEGEFTGIARQNDSVIFFKENWIIKLFGTKPSNYTLATYQVPGVEKGSRKSVVWVNGVLYYLSHTGVCQYSPGGQPVVISERAFGDHRYHNGVAGRHHSKYVLSVENEDEERELFVLDTKTGLWYREDDIEIADCMTYNNILYFTETGGDKLFCMDNGDDLPGSMTEEDDFSWSFETPNLYEEDFGKKYISKVQIHMKAADNMQATVWAQFTYDGPWTELRSLHHLQHRHAIIGVPVRRSDFLKLRVAGVGECEISGIQIDFVRGSEKVWQY